MCILRTLRNGNTLTITKEQILTGWERSVYPYDLDTLCTIVRIPIPGSQQFLHIGRILDGIGFLRYDFIVEDTDQSPDDEPPAIFVLLDESDRSVITKDHPGQSVFDPWYAKKREVYKEEIFMSGGKTLNIDHRLVNPSSSLSGSDIYAIIEKFFIVLHTLLPYEHITINHVDQLHVINFFLKQGFIFTPDSQQKRQEIQYDLQHRSSIYHLTPQEDNGYGFDTHDTIIHTSTQTNISLQMYKKLPS